MHSQVEIKNIYKKTNEGTTAPQGSEIVAGARISWGGGQYLVTVVGVDSGQTGRVFIKWSIERKVRRHERRCLVKTN
jgi:hypothetical protein